MTRDPRSLALAALLITVALPILLGLLPLRLPVSRRVRARRELHGEQAAHRGVGARRGGADRVPRNETWRRALAWYVELHSCVLSDTETLAAPPSASPKATTRLVPESPGTHWTHWGGASASTETHQQMDRNSSCREPTAPFVSAPASANVIPRRRRAPERRARPPKSRPRPAPRGRRPARGAPRRTSARARPDRARQVQREQGEREREREPRARGRGARAVVGRGSTETPSARGTPPRARARACPARGPARWRRRRAEPGAFRWRWSTRRPRL